MAMASEVTTRATLLADMLEGVARRLRSAAAEGEGCAVYEASLDAQAEVDGFIAWYQEAD